LLSLPRRYYEPGVYRVHMRVRRLNLAITSAATYETNYKVNNLTVSVAGMVPSTFVYHATYTFANYPGYPALLDRDETFYQPTYKNVTYYCEFFNLKFSAVRAFLNLPPCPSSFFFFFSCFFFQNSIVYVCLFCICQFVSSSQGAGATARGR
jgi:hypothetical protein